MTLKTHWIFSLAVIATHAIFPLNGAIKVEKKFYTEQEKPSVVTDSGPCTLLTIKGCTRNSSISVSEKKDLLSQKETKITTAYTNNDGVAIVAISTLGYIPGFPVTYNFTDSKKHLKKEVTFVPNPLFVKSKLDGAQVEAKIIAADPVSYMLELTGFDKSENLHFTSVSYDEQMSQQFPVSQHPMILYMPGVIGKRGGVSHLSFTRNSGEILQLDLPWGIEWLRYQQFIDENGKVTNLIDTEEFRNTMPEEAKYFHSNANDENQKNIQKECGKKLDDAKFFFSSKELGVMTIGM